MTGPDWDDDRLDAAFASRAHQAPAAPPDLAVEIRGRIERDERRSAPRVTRSLVGLAAVLAVVAVLVVGVLPPRTSDPALSPSGSSPASSTASAPSATPAASLFGDPITVSQALAIANGDIANDRELVVEGFLSPFLPVPCPSIPAAPNPTLLRCPQDMQWVMERPEEIGMSDAPTGPAFNPSFALVEAPQVPLLGSGKGQPLPVVVVGHFHDRRAARCAPESVDACGRTFVVDQVAAIDGVPQAVATLRSTEYVDPGTQSAVIGRPKDFVEDVDRLVSSVAPDAVVVSRQLVTIGQVIPLEPVLADDGFVPYVANPSHLVWIVTTIDPRDGIPIARTFALFDGTYWFAEVTAEGAMLRERQAVILPSDGAQRPPPSGDPAAFDAAPASVLGITVRDIATLERDRQAAMDDLGRDEIALRAWYVAPDPAARCEPVDLIHAPTPPCDDARHWLLDRPEQYGVEIGQLRTKPDLWPPVLNPVVPIDVPFDVPPTWAGNDPIPQPVIVLGHFNDMRGLNTYGGNRYFVVDALVWTRAGPAQTLDMLTRLTDSATEDPTSVLARLDDVSPNDAVATWTTVVDAGDFSSLDPRMAEEAPEFTFGPPVWIVRRWIACEMDGRQRLAVEWAYTADGGVRVWMSETPDSHPDLATTIDIGPFGGIPGVVRVFDYGRIIVSVRRATAADGLDWQPSNPNRDGIVEVARGASDRDVGLRWKVGTCAYDRRLLVKAYLDLADPQISVEPQNFGGPCPDEPVTRALLITFDRRVDLDLIRSGSRNSTGTGG
jgi:hypothetical protein